MPGPLAASSSRLRFEEVHRRQRDDIAAIGGNARSRGDDLLHFGKIGVDLGLVDGFADHLGNATLVDDHGDRNLLDGIAVLDRGDRFGIDFVVGLLFLLGRLVGRLRATCAALGRCLRYVLFHGRGRIGLRFLGLLVFLNGADGALDARFRIVDGFLNLSAVGIELRRHAGAEIVHAEERRQRLVDIGGDFLLNVLRQRQRAVHGSVGDVVTGSEKLAGRDRAASRHRPQGRERPRRRDDGWKRTPCARRWHWLES